MGQKIFFIPHTSRPTEVPTQLTVSCIPKRFPRIKLSERKFDHPPHLMSRLKKCRVVNLLHLCAYVSWNGRIFTFPSIFIFLLSINSVFSGAFFDVLSPNSKYKVLSPFLHLFHSRFYKRIFPISARTIFWYYSDGVWDIAVVQATDLSFNSIFRWNPTEGAVRITWSYIKLNWVNLLL